MAVLLAGVLMGLGGTIAMDLWAEILARGFGQTRPNWGNVGRWAAQVPKGKLFHHSIEDVPPVPGETGVGWALHYGVGILYGVIWAFLAGPGWLEAPGFVSVWLFALVTIAAGWFLLQPGMGLGWAASATPAPWKVRALGLVAHTVFGLGMYSVALWL